MKRDTSPGKRGFTTLSYLNALEEGLIPHYQPGMLFQQDNAKIHTSQRAQTWFESHGIHIINWPPHSPDLNAIEPCWMLLKRQVFRMRPDLRFYNRSKLAWTEFQSLLKTA